MSKTAIEHISEFTDYEYVILCEDSVEAASEKLIAYMVAELV